MAEQTQGRKGRMKPRARREQPEFDQKIVDLARVTRVTKGGKQLNFRAAIVIGDRKGRVGYGVQKGKDVQIAVEKAVRQAKKNMISVPLVNETIPHRVEAKFKAAKVMMKPAPKGSGIIAGGAVRTVLEMAGVPNASAKMMGKTTNKITNVKAAFDALTSFLPSAVAKAKENEAKSKSAKTAPKSTSTEKPKAEKKPAAKKVAKKPATKKAAAKKPAAKKKAESGDNK